MPTNFNIPPLTDSLTRKNDYLSDVWLGWFSYFYQNLIQFLSEAGIFVPQMTTAVRDQLKGVSNGQMIYNTTVNAPQIFQNGVWKTFTTT